MTATTKAPLGATTTNRKWYLDVNTGTKAAPVWTGVFGITEFTPKIEGSLQSDADFDGEGWGSEVNTLNKWSNEGKVKRAATAAEPTAYDPGQEKLRLAAGKTGVANVVECRWYEMEDGGPRVEAYSGDAAVTWTEDGGGVEALSFASFVLTGRGKRVEIEHPDTATP